MPFFLSSATGGASMCSTAESQRAESHGPESQRPESQRPESQRPESQRPESRRPTRQVTNVQAKLESRVWGVGGWGEASPK